MEILHLYKPPAEMNQNELAEVVIELCFRIHRKWGPGLLESVYEALLVHHLKKNGFFVEKQKGIPFIEDGVKLEIGFRADIIVERKLLLELKSVSQINNSFLKIVLTYLRILDLRLGLLINFGETYLKNGIKRVINGELEPSQQSYYK